MTDTKKELGQHWLHDRTVLQDIVSFAGASSDDTILEIGPGLGTLTDELVASGATITALEFDTDLLKGLRIKYMNSDQVTIIHGDIRTYDYTQLETNYKVVANIPYYLTSHLIRSLSETTNQPAVAVLLVQKEVAERICAQPGKLSILGVTAQYYFSCDLGVVVPSALFTPPPKVDSQVVRLVRRDKRALALEDEPAFIRFVKAGFSEKRKKLSNSLSGGLQLSKQTIETLLESAGIPLSVRAQELSMQQWFTLFETYVVK